MMCNLNTISTLSFHYIPGPEPGSPDLNPKQLGDNSLNAVKILNEIPDQARELIYHDSK